MTLAPLFFKKAGQKTSSLFEKRLGEKLQLGFAAKAVIIAKTCLVKVFAPPFSKGEPPVKLQIVFVAKAPEMFFLE